MHLRTMEYLGESWNNACSKIKKHPAGTLILLPVPDYAALIWQGGCY